MQERSARVYALIVLDVKGRACLLLSNNNCHLRGSPFLKNIVTDITNALPEEEFDKHVLELQKEWRSQSCNTSHIDILFKETYCNRRQWLLALPTGRVAPILDKFPCFEEGNYVSNQMKFMLIAVAHLAVRQISISCLC